MKMRTPCREHGFTLIEVMVAMAILAVLSILTAQTLKSTIDSRSKIQADMSREASVYDALRIMESDIQAAFHYRDINIKMVNELAQENAKGNQGQGGQQGNNQGNQGNQGAGDQGSGAQGGQGGQGNQGDNTGGQQQQQQPNPFGEPRPTPVQVTGFVGDSESLYFTVANHLRTMRDVKESDQAKVGYFVKSCKSSTGKNEQVRCLMRGLSTELDEDVTKVESETVLLENVEEFKLRYLGPGHEDYLDQWKTGQNGDDTTRENFPYAVEISLRIHDKRDKREKPFGATVLAPIRFPNNPPKKDPNAENNQQNQQNGGQGGGGTGNGGQGARANGGGGNG